MIGIASCRDFKHQKGEQVGHFLCPNDGLIHRGCIKTSGKILKCRICGSTKVVNFVVKTTELNPR